MDWRNPSAISKPRKSNMNFRDLIALWTSMRKKLMSTTAVMKKLTQIISSKTTTKSIAIAETYRATTMTSISSREQIA